MTTSNSDGRLTWPNRRSLPITVLIAAKNEASNLRTCIESLSPCARVVVLDSHSSDDSAEISRQLGAEVIQFDYSGGYPKKRQWAIDHVDLATPWVMLIDADESVTVELWSEIIREISGPSPAAGYLITKGFHFLGHEMRYGGFSHAAISLFQNGKARFEQLMAEAGSGLDMEVHERVIVDGPIRSMTTPLIHNDKKGLTAYLDRHNRYASWEAAVRQHYLTQGSWGAESIQPKLFGNTQERRRWLKKLICRMPGEHWLWFFYHYIFRLGFLEGRRGLIASQIRSQYIANVRAKLYELTLTATDQSPRV